METRNAAGESTAAGPWEGRSALITGGSSGIGLATAQLLVEGGARVLVTGRSEDGLQRAATQLGEGAVAVRSDTAAAEDLRALVERAAAELGELDLLFVNAGITGFAPLDQVSETAYDELFAVNAKGAYFTVQALAPLVRRGGGIVLTTSVAGVKGLAGSSAYAATKAAVRSMVRSFARELLDQGVRVNAVSPGPIETGILDRALPTEAASTTHEQMRANNPMGRFGDPREVARAVVFLGLEATYTTGSELAVDGGASQL